MTNHIEEIVEELSILSMERISPYTATTRDFKASAMEIVKAYGDQRAEEGALEVKNTIATLIGKHAEFINERVYLPTSVLFEKGITPPNTKVL